MVSNVRGEVDEVREDRLRRRERDRLRRLLSESLPTNTPCTVPEVEAAVEPAVEPANSDTSIVKSHVEHLMDTHVYRTNYFE